MTWNGFGADGWWRDLRRGQRDTILPMRTWKRRWWHRRPSWAYVSLAPPSASGDAATKRHVDAALTR